MRSLNQPCYFWVGMPSRRFPTTSKGLLQARLAAKKYGESSMSVRMTCPTARPQTSSDYEIEVCRRRVCAKR